MVFAPTFPLYAPVIPAKAGIQTANAVMSARERDMPVRSRLKRMVFAPTYPLSPRHSRESGNPDGGRRYERPPARFVRIRIYGIMGFSGFSQVVSDWRALIPYSS